MIGRGIVFLFLFFAVFLWAPPAARAYVPLETMMNPPTPIAGSEGAISAEGEGAFFIDPVTGAINWAYLVKKFAEWSENIALVGQIIQLVMNVFNLLTDGIAALVEKVGLEAGAFLNMQSALARLDERLADAEIDSDIVNTENEEKLRLAIPRMPTGINQFLCKALLLNQITGGAEAFERNVAALALSSIERLYRGERDDGNGPQYVYESESLRRAAKFASPMDGYASAFISTEKAGPRKRTFVDADLTPFSMDGAVTLELPETKTETIKLMEDKEIDVQVPDPKNVNQKMWIAGLYYCVHLAGPRPSASWGESMTRPAGKVERARFDNLLALQSAAIKPCADLLAYYTRPNETARSMINEQKKLCLAAKGYLSDEELRDNFDDCEKGLSAYQADFLRQAVCKSAQYYLSQAQNNAITQEMAKDMLSCSVGWSKWKTKVDAKHAALTDAVRALAAMQRDWSGVGGGR